MCSQYWSACVGLRWFELPSIVTHAPKLMSSLLKRFKYGGAEGADAAEIAAGQLVPRRRLSRVAEKTDPEDYIKRRFAVAALGSLQKEAKPWLKAIMKALSDQEAGVRYQAALAVVQVGDPVAEYSDLLVKALEDQDCGVRLNVVELIQCLGPKIGDQGEVLLEVLQTDPDTHVRIAATRALLTVDPTLAPKAASAHSEILRDEGMKDEVFFRATSAQALGILGETAREHAELLRHGLNDKFHGVRSAAATALEGLGSKEVLPVSTTLANLAKADPYESVRNAASSALCKLCAAEALRDEDEAMRFWAVSSLAGDAVAAASHVDELVGMLKDPSETNRRLTAVAIEKIGAAAAPHGGALLSALGDDSAEVRLAVMQSIISVSGQDMIDEALDTSAKGFGSEVPALRAAAADCLACTGLAAKGYIDQLAKALDDEHFMVRVAAVKAILGSGRMSVSATGAKLADLAFKDPDIDVRRAATACLREYRLDRRYGLPEQRI